MTFRVYSAAELQTMTFPGPTECVCPDRPAPDALTWEELVYREPLLRSVLALVRQIPPRPGFCANVAWYGWGGEDHGNVGVRALLDHLVGWHAIRDDRVLRTSDAYHVAYDVLYHALPDCRHPSRLGCV